MPNAMQSASGRGVMERISRWMLALSSALLAVAFVVPIWRISLLAPQYPEGLGMLIRVNTITGIKPADLQNINGLNHYIGMKAIVPDAIPVLHVMPYVLGALVLLGLCAALYGRRWAAWSWLGLLAAAGTAGLYEFWAWSYDYGHNLASDAIIEVPGMTYQPPLMGTKQLLNFTATSWPDAGGWLAGAAFLIALAALLFFRKKQKGVVVAASLSTVRVAAAALLGVGALAFGAPHRLAAQNNSVIVSLHGPVKSLSSALKIVKTGGTVVVEPGRYVEHGIVVDRPVTIIGRGLPLIDGDNKGEILRITADDVTVTGLRLARAGVSYTQDRAAIRVENASNCRISNNSIEDGFFGIYLAKVTGCRIEHNTLRARNRTEAMSRNGIHLWSARAITIANNDVRGFRDGIYFEFVHDTRVAHNISATNMRYGLHFMYSDDCSYVGNTFRNNGSGVAVMYTKRVHMTANHFEHNWGSAAYGLLLKEIYDSRLERNVFEENTTGLLADGATRVQAIGNTFVRNGWAVKVEGSTQDGFFSANNFIGNTFDVSTNNREPTTKFEGNYWDAYRGYDLNRDGVGDVPHPPVRLFSVIVGQNPQAIVLMRSALVSLLEAAERAMPSLVPELFVDPRPAMRKSE
ncbi:MAG: nitrous oxide reductase family maturation protein NosD [Gemmatimonadales bacterium]